MRPSEGLYDWLGHGIYFWEGNPSRALAWARTRLDQGKIKKPFVLGAVIDLRHCLDLFDHDGLAQVKKAHRKLEQLSRVAGVPMPENVGNKPDKTGRALDCAVLNALHQYRQENEWAAYDSVRGPFLEGEPLYPGASFRSENHIQICVRNTDCIKGYFRPPASVVRHP